MALGFDHRLRRSQVIGFLRERLPGRPMEPWKELLTDAEILRPPPKQKKWSLAPGGSDQRCFNCTVGLRRWLWINMGPNSWYLFGDDYLRPPVWSI